MGEEHLINLQPGTVIAGRYEVVKCIGAGSMGVAYACRHRELGGHLVGVKVLFPEVAQDKVAAARFRNEIFASYRVSHPNVVRAYEYIRDGDLVAYTMEYVGGGDLASKIGRGKTPLPIIDSVKYLAQMCAGVQAIHDAGIVHRDLKPENILLSKDGQVKIADFGIARVDRGQKLTEHGGVVGTIDYVSPEYMLNSQVDWRSDIYALGILAYEMLTSELPFRGESVYAAMTKRLKSDPKPPSSLRTDCPPELDTIILKMMARDPDQRYQSAAEVSADLLQLSMRLGVPVSGVYNPIVGGTGDKYVGPSISPIPDENLNEAVPDTSSASVKTNNHIRSSGSHNPSIDSPQNRSRFPEKKAGVNSQQEAEPQRYSRAISRSAPRAVGNRVEAVNRPLVQSRAASQASPKPRGASSSDSGILVEEPAYDFSYDPSPASNSETQYRPTERPGIEATQSEAKGIWATGVSDTPTLSSNPDNLRKLSQMSEQQQSTLFVDIILVLLTLLIGLAIGFLALYLLQGNSVNSGVTSGLSVTSGL